MHHIPDLLIVVAADPGGAEAARHGLMSLGASSVSFQDLGADRLLVYGGLFDAVSAATAAASLRADGWAADVRPAGGGHLTAWQAHTAPVMVGDRLRVCFPWSEVPRSHPGCLVEIDPDGAFGTGSHPTTRLLLSALAARIAGGESVLDVGCGSGVLAVCAARLGAGRVEAVDISEIAVAACAKNAARNHVDVSASTSWPSGRFDVVVANISASVLIELAPAIQERVGGWLGLSGISPAQVSKVVAAYDLSSPTIVTDDDWAAVLAR